MSTACLAPWLDVCHTMPAGLEKGRMDVSVVELVDVTMRRNQVQILRGIDWTIQSGEHWVVLGRNGCGKTSLLRIMAAMEFPTSGTVDLLGHRLGRTDVFTLRPRIGFASTSLLTLIPNSETVRNAVVTGLTSTLGRWREQFSPEEFARADLLMSQLGLSEFPNRRIGLLSEGERRRVGLARSLMAAPDLLLLDEPAAGLDLIGREDQLVRFDQLVADGTIETSVTVTHHLEEISESITHLAVMAQGRFVAQGPIDRVLNDETLTNAYGMPIRCVRNGSRWSAQVVR